ncbi:MAG: hypothetical protein QXF21_06160 [Thermoproteota archaeon]
MTPFSLSLYAVKNALGWMCPSCGRELDRCLIQAYVPALEKPAQYVPRDDGFSEVFLRLNSTLAPYLQAGVSSSRTEECFSLDNFGEKHLVFEEGLFSDLTRLLGRLTVLYGSPFCNQVAGALCVDAQLPREKGGLGSTVILMDGSNVFNPYFISDYAQRMGLDAETVLEKMLVSRAFTYHQMTSLVARRLPETIRNYGSKMVVALDMAQLYLTGEGSSSEVKALFNQALSSLSTLTEKEHVAVIVTHSQASSRMLIDQLLLGKADLCVRVDSIKSKLEGYHTLTTFLEG